MIDMNAFWKGRDTKYGSELTAGIRANAQITVDKVNQLLDRANLQSIEQLNSGWRPSSVNEATANAASGSKHLSGQAADIPDADRVLAGWCVGNLDSLETLGLWMEDPRWTPTWVHVQIVPPHSGRRVFIPSTAPAPDPSFPVTWS